MIHARDEESTIGTLVAELMAGRSRVG